MEIELNPEQNLLRDTVRRFAEEVVKPRAKEIDESGEFPRGFYDQAEQKKEFLTPLAAGRKLGCFALTEPGAGSDAASLRSTARKDGDDYVLNGNKIFITNGTDADVALVFASVDLEKKHKGITAVLDPTDSESDGRATPDTDLGENASGH